MAFYNGKFVQHLSIIIKANDHHSCLRVTNFIKKQCDAWAFNVEYIERKSARKGDVLGRELAIKQTAYASDVLIFKEAIKRVCLHFQLHVEDVEVVLNDRGLNLSMTLGIYLTRKLSEKICDCYFNNNYFWTISQQAICKQFVYS